MARRGAGGAQGRTQASQKATRNDSKSGSKKLTGASTATVVPESGIDRATSKDKVSNYVELQTHHAGKQPSVTAAEVRRKAEQETAPKVMTTDFKFTGFVSFAIILNAFVLGFEMDWEQEFQTTFLILNHVFTGIFFVEFCCRQICEGPRRYFVDSANLLDFVLVFLAVVELWIIPLVGVGVQMDTRSMSVLRILRLLRLVRVLRVFKIFKELTIMVDGMSKTKAIIFWGSIFLLVIVYMFAMTSTMMFGNAYVCDDPTRRLSDESSQLRYLSGTDNEKENCTAYYQFDEYFYTQEQLFGTLAKSMSTLYMCLFEGCGFDVIRPMIHTSPITMIYWYLFIFLTSFGILNVILGLFCETVITSALEQDKQLKLLEEDTRQKNLQQLKGLWESMDKDNSGEITAEEFHAALTTDDEVIRLLEGMGLDEEDDLFEVLDYNRTNSLSHHEFFQGMMLLINGTRPMTTKDNVATYLTCQSNHNLLQSFLQLLQDSKMLGEITVVKEGLRTHILLPGQQSRSPTPRAKTGGALASTEEDVGADDTPETQIPVAGESELKEAPVPAESALVTEAPESFKNGLETSSTEAPFKAKTVAKETCQNVAVDSGRAKQVNGVLSVAQSSSLAEVDLVSENFTLHDSFASLQARVSQLDRKMESRLGGVENQLKVQQHEFVNMSRKMDSIAHILEHILEQSQKSQQRQHDVCSNDISDSVTVLQ